MRQLVFLLEEESAKAMLQGLMPRLFPDAGQIDVRYLAFEGKQDLDRNITKYIRGWLNREAAFLVLRDQDRHKDCGEVKRRLVRSCEAAGKRKTRVRLACRELEAFYLGDLAAVEVGLGVKGIGRLQDKAKFRDPDRLVNPSAELAKLTKDRYAKVAGSRAIGQHLHLTDNRSKSHSHLVRAIRELIEVHPAGSG